MKTKVYTLDQIELVETKEATNSQLTDLTENEDNDILYKTVMTNPPLKFAYFNSPSIEKLRKMFGKLYLYTDAQFEYLEVNFKEDLSERLNIY